MGFLRLLLIKVVKLYVLNTFDPAVAWKIFANVYSTKIIADVMKILDKWENLKMTEDILTQNLLLVGYNEHSKEYEIYLHHLEKIIVSRNVIFEKTKLIDYNKLQDENLANKNMDNMTINTSNKTRFVARGFEYKGKNWKLSHMDMKTTFLYGDLKEEV
uniref:Retroviral polymerase SH3-like domain-containing protein n=1 Tax=Physcomitrium patens TaxID=3218 RepID=A0A7I4AZ68_PHYPA